MNRRPVSVLLTCEHAGNVIPQAWASYFNGAAEALLTHRGYDIGALPVALALANGLSSPLYLSTTSRLLIDLNRSLGNSQVFSEWSNQLDQTQQTQIIETYYHPYRRNVIDQVRSKVGDQFVLHISIHSFTPVMNGETRTTDIGVLFDPERSAESHIAERWKQSLQAVVSGRTIHLNQPYLGIDDGFTTYLRTQFNDEQYAGIELEVNQGLLLEEPGRNDLAEKILAATRSMIQAVATGDTASLAPV